MFISIKLFSVVEKKEESNSNCGDKGGKDGPLVELVLGPLPPLSSMVHTIGPVCLVLVVQGTMVAWCHHRIDLARPSACPWAVLHRGGRLTSLDASFARCFAF